MPILLITIVLSGLGFGLVLPGMPFVAENLGASPMLATFILGLYAWGQFIATTVWGRLSDRIGRKPILVITNGGTAIAYLLMAFAPNLWVLAAGRALSGLMGGLAPAMAYVSDVTPAGEAGAGHGLGRRFDEPRFRDRPRARRRARRQQRGLGKSAAAGTRRVCHRGRHDAGDGVLPEGKPAGGAARASRRGQGPGRRGSA